MGRLSTFAKNRILNMRFQKCFRIKQIAQTLVQEDSIKVSRKSISTFLKKYIETKSINDKPRSGRNKKLTPEEINLIGEVTRLNRDITAPKIKEYLNLNVSTYTILRASKLFEWNKLNPNSNQAKREAALQRKVSSEERRRHNLNRRKKLETMVSTNEDNTNTSEVRDKLEVETTKSPHRSSRNQTLNANSSNNTVNSSQSNTSVKEENRLVELGDDADLGLIPEEEVQLARTVSSSPMVFTTKMLYKVFTVEEMLGHNVSGKTFNKFIKNKKALDEKRVNYIRWLVERNFESDNREELWKACRTAINKSIRNHEIRVAGENQQLTHLANGTTIVKLSNDLIDERPTQSNSMHNTTLTLQPNMTIVQITNDLSTEEMNLQQQRQAKTGKRSATKQSVPRRTSSRFSQQQLQQQQLLQANTNNSEQVTPIMIRLTNDSDPKTYIDLSKTAKMDYQESALDELTEVAMSQLYMLPEREIVELRNSCCSAMIFSTRVLLKIFTKEQLIGHNIAGKAFGKNGKNKQPLDEGRINYIKLLVDKYYIQSQTGRGKNLEDVWLSCRKAINRVIRNFEIKESKLIKTLDEDEDDEEEEEEEEEESEEDEHAVGVLEQASYGGKSGHFKLLLLEDHSPEMDSANHDSTKA